MAQSTSFTSMGSLVRVQLSPPLRSPCGSRASFFTLHPGVYFPGVFFVDMNRSENTSCPHYRAGSAAGIIGVAWLPSYAFQILKPGWIITSSQAAQVGMLNAIHSLPEQVQYQNGLHRAVRHCGSLYHAHPTLEHPEDHRW